jgi:hypothetical protein
MAAWDLTLPLKVALHLPGRGAVSLSPLGRPGDLKAVIPIAELIERRLVPGLNPLASAKIEVAKGK